MTSMVVFYPCLNIQETTQFYLDTIQLQLYQDQGACKIFDTGYGYLGFCEYDDHELASRVCISFNLPSKEAVNAQYKQFLEMGIQEITPPQQHPRFDVYSFFMKDPNGYAIEFQKIKD